MTDEQRERIGQYASALKEWAEEEKIGGDHGKAEAVVEEVLKQARGKLTEAVNEKKVAGTVVRGLKKFIDDHGITVVTPDPQ